MGRNRSSIREGCDRQEEKVLMITIHDYLPKFVMPEWTNFEDEKGFRIGLKDIRDDYLFDCQVFICEHKITNDTIHELSWEYFTMLFEEGVLEL